MHSALRRRIPHASTLGLLLATGCGDADAAGPCATAEIVQLTASEGSVRGVVRSTTDGDLIMMTDDGEGELRLARPCAGEAPVVAHSADFWAPSWLDAADQGDEPLVCDRTSGRFLRVDPSGATEPKPVLSDMFCRSAMASSRGILLWKGVLDPAAAGAILGDGIDATSASLWRLPDFPQQGQAEQVLARGAAAATWLVSVLPALPDSVFYFTESDVRIHDLKDGRDRALPGELYSFPEMGRWLLLRSPADTMNLHDVERDVTIPLGSYTATDEAPEDDTQRPELGNSWEMNRTGTHVLHMPFEGALEAFDLQGTRFALPLTRRPFRRTADGGVMAQGDRATQVQLAYPGDAAPRLLTYPLGVSNTLGDVRGADIEVLDAAGNLYAIPLDGSPFRLIARSVSEDFVRLDDTHLLTLYLGKLTTIDLQSNDRTVHARDVYGFWPAHPGGYYFAVDPDASERRGLWYLPPNVLIPAPT